MLGTRQRDTDGNLSTCLTSAIATLKGLRKASDRPAWALSQPKRQARRTHEQGPQVTQGYSLLHSEFQSAWGQSFRRAYLKNKIDKLGGGTGL